MGGARRRSGQSALELCLGLAAILVALVAMFTIIRGAIEGRWKAAGDSFGHGTQYEPRVTQVQ